jgi:hypothetical protein
VTEAERDALIEEVVSAHRERDVDGRPVPPPAWWDLAPQDLDDVYQRQMLQRRMERAVNERGWSATVQVVIERLR